MNLQIGSRVGSYEITGRIGAGGMGEVFRARDTKLNREAAIKILPPGFAEDSTGVSRFRREAQVLASLNHPNIAAIYGLEESNGSLALALELVEGEDLALRLKRGPIPVEEAVAIAKQITEGLEAAHEKAIIHRDLKPANIKLTKAGATKILDFGLAKAYEGDTVLSGSSDSSQSPTMAKLRTETGIILGTASYMSPEQARGKEVDRRADVWAFGVVLYEMLTARRLFYGETISDTLAAVLTREPDWTALPENTPQGVRRLLSHCLAKDRNKRLHDIADARLLLEEADESSIPAAAPPKSNLRFVPWILAIAALLLSAWLMMNRNAQPAASREVTHVDVAFPPGVEPFSGLQGGFAISPDGRTVGMIGIRYGVRRLYLRKLDDPNAREISDTSGVNSSSFSPDGTALALVPGGAVVTRISLADMQRTVVASGTDLGSGILWSRPGIIYNKGGALWMIAPEGGTPRQLTTLDASRNEVLHADPLILPDGRTLLFSSLTNELGTERIEAMSLETGKRSVVIERALSPVWSTTGHLLFGREGGLLAVAFDPVAVKVQGSATPVIPAGTIGTVRTGSLGYGLSTNGTLLYIGTDYGTKRAVSVARDGSALALPLPPGAFGNPRVSPDGRRVLLENSNKTIDALDLARGTRSTLSPPAYGTTFSTWTADGNGVVFRRFNIPYWTSADGTGKSGPLASGLLNDYPAAPGPDPDTVLVVRIQPETSGDIFLMSISGKFPPKPVLVAPGYDGGPQSSPDGNWLLYQSNQSGQPEIYVRRYPLLDRSWQVSEGGGVQARWSYSSREIYYRNGKDMMAVTFDGAGAEPVFGKPQALFADEYDFGQGISIPNYDVTHEGRFIMLRRETHGNHIRAILNWDEELKRLLPKR